MIEETPPLVTEKIDQLPQTQVIVIAAIGKNNELGRNNDLLWHLGEDMQFFKETTWGHYVIMGRKSFESIPPKYRPLPNRVNVIISRNEDYMVEECYTCASLEEAISLAQSNGEEAAFITGGGQIYRLALENGLVDEMYLTHVDASFADADTFFPSMDESQWTKTHIRSAISGTLNEFPFEIYHYQKKK
jgi:dihydrofolate reductase